MYKATYTKNRRAGKRGQGELPQPKIHPKGDTVKYLTREGEKAEYPNADGGHMIQVGRRFKKVNRTEARRYANTKNRSASKPNYNYQVEKNGFKHAVNEPKHAVNEPKHEREPFSEYMTNHIRHRQRQIIREANRSQVS